LYAPGVVGENKNYSDNKKWKYEKKKYYFCALNIYNNEK